MVNKTFDPNDQILKDKKTYDMYENIISEADKLYNISEEKFNKLTVNHTKKTNLYDNRPTKPDPRIGSRTNRKMYEKKSHAFKNKHILMKLDYQTFLIESKISNHTLNLHFKNVLSLFHSELEAKGIDFNNMTYGVAESIYHGSEEIKNEFQKLFVSLKGSNVRDAIELAAGLHSQLWYFQDLYSTAPVWNEIELQIDFSMHILTFRQKVKAFHAFNSRSPKKGSLLFRKKLEDNLLKTDFKIIPIREVLEFSTATRRCKNNDFAHRKFFLNLKKRGSELENLTIENQLGLEIAYTFFNNRLLPFERKKLVHEEEEVEEEIIIMEMVYRSISDRIGLMSDSDLLRLVSILNMVKVDYYSELGIRVTRVIQSRVNSIEPDVLIVLLQGLTKANRKRSVGDKKFWDSVSSFILKNFAKFDKICDKFLFCELFEILAYHDRLPSKDYHKLFRKKIISWVESDVLNYDELVSLGNGIMCMDLNYPNTKTILEDFQSIVTAVSYQKTNSGLKHHQTLKYMRMLGEALNPTWSLDIWDILWYHAEKEFSPWKLKKRLKTHELTEVISFLQDKLEVPMLPVYCHENSFLIDIANQRMKLGIYLKTPDHIVSSSKLAEDFDTTEGRILPERQLQINILRAQGWQIYELDYLEFLAQGDNRAEWLLAIVQAEYEKCLNNGKNPDAEEIGEALRLLKDRANKFRNTIFDEYQVEEVISWAAVEEMLDEKEIEAFEETRIEEGLADKPI